MKRIADKLSGRVQQLQMMYPIGPCGVIVSQRDDIVKKLCPLMPANQKQFWEALKTNDQVDIDID